MMYCLWDAAAGTWYTGTMETKMSASIVRENRWLIGGMGTLWFSLMVSPYYPASLSPALTMGDVAVVSERHFVYGLLLIAAFVGLILGRESIGTERSRIAPSVATLAGGIGSLICFLAPAQGHQSAILEIVALILVAIYVAFYFIAWLRLASQRGPQKAVVIIGVSFGLFSIAWSVLIMAGDVLSGVFGVLCPLLAGLCLHCGFRRTDDFEAPASDRPASLRVLPWGVVVLCVVFIYFGTVAVRLFTTMGVGAGNIGMRGILPQLVTSFGGLIIVAAFTIVFARRDASSFNVVSTVAVLALVNMGALLAVMLADPAGPFVLIAKRVLVAAEHSAEVLLIAVLAYETARRRLSGILVFGMAGIVVVVGPQMIGLNFMHATGLLDLLSESPYVAPLAAVGAFFITGAAIVMLIKYSGGTVAKSRIQSEQWPEELCREATAAYEVTPRELEVVTYAYRGYSAKKIAETLLVSESTVKAHLTHAYRKLGVHTKQELIALVDSYRHQ